MSKRRPLALAWRARVMSASPSSVTLNVRSLDVGVPVISAASHAKMHFLVKGVSALVQIKTIQKNLFTLLLKVQV